MKNHVCVFMLCLLILALFTFAFHAHAQITIAADDFPTDIGTLIITKNNTVDSIVVDIGSAGENQQWHLDQAFPEELHRQLIVPTSETTYNAFFPESDAVTRYVGNLGNFMDSYYFENTVGTFFLFQRKTPDRLLLQGIGFDSTTVNFGAFSLTCSGYFTVQPNHLLYHFPLEYNKSWQSISNFSMRVDTLLGTTPVALVADVRDSAHNVVDGWGRLELPTTTYECLRVKSDIVLNEKLLLNGLQIRSKTNRVVNYYWLNKENGVVAKVSSFLNPENDSITMAKRISRLHMFNPQINFAIADTVAEPDDIIDVPIHISDLSDLDIKKISMCINCDSSMVRTIGIVKMNTLIEEWREPSCAFIDSTFQVEFSGDVPLTHGGVLCYLRVKILPTFISDTTAICLGNIQVDQAGPRIAWQPGQLIINAAPSAAIEESDQVPLPCYMFPNYPNPFNNSTTISFQLENPSHVNVYVYNSTGQLISILADRHFDSGDHKITWHGVDGKNRPLPSGIYFCRFEAIDLQTQHRFFVLTRKMILLR